MALDLNQVALQIEGMAAELKAGEKEREEHLRFALDTLHAKAADLDSLKRKIAVSKTTWLVAGLVDGLDQCHQLPQCPSRFTVLATDGSHIDVDRHRPTRCYLINIGSVILHYGENPNAILDSSPVLYSEKEDLSITDPSGSNREEPIAGALLGIKRSVDECRPLVRLAEGLPDDSPALALLDGSLILWGLAGQAYPEFVTKIFLDDGLLKSLDDLRELSIKRQLAVASYISFPRSTDVVNALRVALCPHEPADCDRYCSGRNSSGTRDCDAVAGVSDRELFGMLLAQGERSPNFISRSSVVRNHYREHEVRFFYLRVDDEVARVEIPRWVAEGGNLLDLVHALVFDQCRRGQGYPVALSEAHEKAVVTGADREQFWQLVEMALAEEHLPAPSSAKSQSKRTRWI